MWQASVAGLVTNYTRHKTHVYTRIQVLDFLVVAFVVDRIPGHPLF